MNSTIVLVGASVSLPSLVVLQAGGAPACTLAAKSFALVQPSSLSLASIALFRRHIRPYSSVFGADDRRSQLLATAPSDQRRALSP